MQFNLKRTLRNKQKMTGFAKKDTVTVANSKGILRRNAP